MSSMDLDAPPLKLILTVISIVVGLHVLTAVALVTIKSSEPKNEPLEVTPPIEIQLMVAPTENQEPVKIAEESEAVVAIKSQLESAAAIKPQTLKKSEPFKEMKPLEEMELTTKKVVKTTTHKEVSKPSNNTQSDTQKENNRKSVSKEQNNQKNNALLTETDTSVAAATKRAQDIADAKAIADAKKAQDIADAKAVADAKRAQDIADARAVADAKRAQDIADAKAIADAKKIASNKPANFEVTPAHWLVTPDFYSFDLRDYNFKSNRISAVLSMSVNANGTISNIKIKKSSGNNKFDIALKRKLAQGKLKPFDRNGESVQGNATLPLVYEIN